MTENERPCAPDCAERKKGCHASCSRYEEYAAKQEAKRQERQKAAELKEYKYTSERAKRNTLYKKKHRGR